MRMKGLLLLAALLAVPLLFGLGVGWAQEDEAVSSAPSGPMPSMWLGQVTAVEGDVFVLREEGGETIRFTVTPETVGHGRFKAGDWVIASVSPDGKAAAITNLYDREGVTSQPMTSSPPEIS